MVPRIVDCDHQGVTSQKGQSEIEPEVPVLVVNDIRIEAPHLAQDSSDHSELLNPLPKPGHREGEKFEIRLRPAIVRGEVVIGQDEQDIVVCGQRPGLHDAVVAEGEADPGDLHGFTPDPGPGCALFATGLKTRP
jgi:hypothetical protein